jgi:hypothetical protein
MAVIIPVCSDNPNILASFIALIRLPLSAYLRLNQTGDTT